MMIYRLLACLCVGCCLSACEEAPPPSAPEPVVHVSGFPVGHPLNPATIPEHADVDSNPTVDND